jgi:CheY-like chemotaxis protein
MFVDEDQVQLNLLSELMKREGWPFFCCLNANDALCHLEKESYEIIFTDIHIPGMEGVELVQRIRELDFPEAATIPVIAFSADRQKFESELKASGFTGFLLKPFSVQQLLEIIEKYTSFKRNTNESNIEMNEFGWKKIMDFVVNDKDAAMKVIDSFIEEANKDKELLKVAFQQEDNNAIKVISHKMLSLMRMISAQEIVSILTDFVNNEISKEKELTLFRLLEEKIKEAKMIIGISNNAVCHCGLDPQSPAWCAVCREFLLSQE